MSRFLKFCLVASVLLTVLLALVDYPFELIARKSSDTISASWYDFYENTVNADVLFLGSSRAMNHIDPSIIDKELGVNSFNLGLQAAHYDAMLARYEMYRKNNPPPGLVLINVDHKSLSRTGLVEPSLGITYFHDKMFRQKVLPLYRHSVSSRFIPMWRFHGFGLTKWLKRNPRVMNKGYICYPGIYHSTYQDLLDLDLRYVINQYGVRSLEDLINVLKVDGCSIVFVFAPMYERARNMLADFDKWHSYYDSLSNNLSVPILDYSLTSISSDSTLFCDALHLNPDGSRLYTSLLAEDLKKMFPDSLRLGRGNNNHRR
ncbi:MAG: hypothetical protein J6L98_02085 [Bacteroidales bacterium]|nr:hypothetical protein [Bacteroidales bacterium]